MSNTFDRLPDCFIHSDVSDRFDLSSEYDPDILQCLIDYREMIKNGCGIYAPPSGSVENIWKDVLFVYQDGLYVLRPYINGQFGCKLFSALRLNVADVPEA